MNHRQDTELNIVKEASKKGVKEDILHVSIDDDGYDLRNGNNPNQKQKIDENDNA